MKSKAAIIGSGIGGMATAIRLAMKGYEVHVFEKNNVPGGKIGELTLAGCRFDTGPSLFTLPSLVDELFTLAGENPGDHFRYIPLRSSCRYFFDDGALLNAWTDRKLFAAEVESVTGEPAGNIIAFLDECAELYDLTADMFIFSPFYKLDNFRKPESLKIARNFGKLNAFSSMHDIIRRHFSSVKVIQLFDRYATYNGSSPYRAPGTLNMIAHLEHNMGAYFPEKGMRDIIGSVSQLAQRCGVIIHTATEVLAVRREGRKITGVETAEGFMDALVTVSDMDVIPFYSDLMKDERVAQREARQERSTSALIFYWVMKKRFSELDLHNIFFSSDYPGEFNALRQGRVTADPTIYVFASSRTVSSDAPPEKDNWFVMINVPPDTGQDWSMIVSRAREDIINKVSKRLGYDIRDYIEAQRFLDPPLIEKLTMSYRGALYGSSSNSRFAAFRRHPNMRRKYENLWFVGGSVHPGGGIPLCLASAKIASEMILPA
jgi:phytoene desaturase